MYHMGEATVSYIRNSASGPVIFIGVLTPELILSHPMYFECVGSPHLLIAEIYG